MSIIFGILLVLAVLVLSGLCVWGVVAVFKIIMGLTDDQE